MAKIKPTFMRADKDLLNILKECKISDRESYAEVVKRLMKKNAFVDYRKEVLKKKLRSSDKSIGRIKRFGGTRDDPLVTSFY